MALASVLIDSGFLFSLLNQTDPVHNFCVKSLQQLNVVAFVPEITLAEVGYLFRIHAGTSGVIQFLNSLAIFKPNLISVTYADLYRASEIMQLYKDAKLDVVDCCIMALAERLNIKQICTFDRRDFSIFRPKHCDYLELIP